MTETDFGIRLARLLRAMNELATLLQRHGETHWAEWITTSRAGLLAYDARAFDHLLGAFGGMGSLTDLRISTMNGHVVDPGTEEAANVALDELRTAIYDDATNLSRDRRSSS